MPGAGCTPQIFSAYLGQKQPLWPGNFLRQARDDRFAIPHAVELLWPKLTRHRGLKTLRGVLYGFGLRVFEHRRW